MRRARGTEDIVVTFNLGKHLSRLGAVSGNGGNYIPVKEGTALLQLALQEGDEPSGGELNRLQKDFRGKMNKFVVWSDGNLRVVFVVNTYSGYAFAIRGGNPKVPIDDNRYWRKRLKLQKASQS